MSACNQNDDDPTAQPDKAKPVIVVSNPTLVNGIILDATQPQSLTISSAGRINATDNSGKVSLSLQDVVGLSKSQIELRANGELIANNITAATPIGRGHVVVRATDASGNTANNTVYFDISPTASSTQATIKPTQSHSFSFAVMPNITAASVSMPNNVTGVSGQASLVGNQVVIALNTNSSAVAGEFKPQVSLTTTDGKVYPLVLTVMVKTDTPTEFDKPSVTIVDGVITAMSSGIADADGEGAEVIYANGEPVIVGTKLKPGTYTITSQREVNENGIMIVKDNELVGELVVEAPKVNAPTTYNEPILSINQDTNTVSIKNMGDLVKDLDGVKDVTVYLEADGVRIGNSQGLYANVLTSTSADVAYTISADYLTKNGVTGQYESGTHTFTKKAVLNKEAPADTTPPSKVSEDLPWIDAAGATNASGTITLSEDIASVSDAKFVDAKTGWVLTGGAVSVSVDPIDAKVVRVDYTINPWWG